MPHNLKAALGWLQREPGTPLFPCTYDKSTGQHIPLTKWKYSEAGSSNEPAVIEEWAKTFSRHKLYYCIALQRMHNLTVLDVDIKNDKDGETSLKELESIHGALPDTLMSKTPSGGYHLLFECEAPLKVGVNRLGRGIDVPVMIPVPGSKAYGKGDYEIEIDVPVAKLPSWAPMVAGVTDSNGQRAERPAPLIGPGDPLAMKLSLKYLKSPACPEAIAFSHGNDTTFKVICVLKDNGLHAHEAEWLMSTEYNLTKARPPWSPSELKGIVHNVYNYSQGAIGCRHPASIFKGCEVPAAALPALEKTNKFLVPVSVLRTQVGDRSYIVKQIILEKSVNLWFGEPGVCKSFAALSLGFAVSQGLPWCGQKTTASNVVYLAAEGHAGMPNRISAAMDAAGLPPGTELPFVVSQHSFKMDSPEKIIELVSIIQNAIKDHNYNPDWPLLVIIDTLASAFGSGRDENSTQDMNLHTDMLRDAMRLLDCTIIEVHHSGRTNKGRARGASALDGAMDAIFKIDTDDGGKVCLRKALKFKDGQPAEDKFMETLSVPVGIDVDGDPITSLALVYDPDHVTAPIIEKEYMGKAQSAFRDMLEHEPEGLTPQEIREIYNDEYKKRQSISNTHRTLKALLQKEIAVKLDGVYYAIQHAPIGSLPTDLNPAMEDEQQEGVLS